MLVNVDWLIYVANKINVNNILWNNMIISSVQKPGSNSWHRTISMVIVQLYNHHTDL